MANPRLVSCMWLFPQFHASLLHMICFFYQQPSSVIMLCLARATHKLHYHIIITLLNNYDEALTSAGDHPFLFTACLSFHRVKAIKALQRACLGVAGHLSTTPRWGIPLRAFPTATTTKLAGLFSTLFL